MRSERKPDQLREVKITRNYTKYAEGSVLVEFGDTKVLCNASVSNDVPPFLKGTDSGWVTAEYSMLPRSTGSRITRDAVKGKINGRTHEIQRLIGRSLRSVVDMKKLKDKTIILDADVIQADGGTRTAAITGCFVAMHDAVMSLISKGKIKENPINSFVAAVSVGMVQDIEMLDLDYSEDSMAQVDMNVVMTGNDEFIEIQSTAEKKTFSEKNLGNLVALAKKGIKEIIILQKEAMEKK